MIVHDRVQKWPILSVDAPVHRFRFAAVEVPVVRSVSTVGPSSLRSSRRIDAGLSRLQEAMP